jgi:hypothetical protein
MSDDLITRLRDLGDHAAYEPRVFHEAADEITRLSGALIEAHIRLKATKVLVEGLQIIAGERQCLDNLMGPQDVACEALDIYRKAGGGE